METFTKRNNEFLKFLDLLAASYPNVLNIDILKNDFPIESIEIYLNFLNLFNVLDKTVSDQIKLINDNARNFILSLTTYISEDLSLISDWESFSADYTSKKESGLGHGLVLLNEMEKRRSEQLGSTKAHREIENMTLVIKARLEDIEKDVYLFQFDPESRIFKAIGGRISNEEELEIQINNLLKKELPNNNLKYPTNYVFEDFAYPIETFKVSNKTGLYTKHKVSFFRLNFKVDKLNLTSLDRWLTLEELKNGHTSDGIEILSYFKYVPNQDSFITKLTKLTPCFPKPLPLTNFIDTSEENKKEDSKYEALLKLEESEELEFKSSLHWDYKLNNTNKILEKVIAKTVNGFLNSSGGTLVIGVNDDKEILGIDKDIETLQKKDIDGFMQFIITLISTAMGVEFTNLIKVSFQTVDSKTICIVEVKKSLQPVFFKENQNREFYVRAGNSTRELNIEEIYKYIQMNW